MVIGLCVTTYAATRSGAKSEGFFQTGEIKININDGKSVIDAGEFMFEPGATIEKEFFVKNEGTGDVYFKVYFEDIKGELANILNVSLFDGDELLFKGTADKITRNNVLTAEKILTASETRNLRIIFNYPASSGNAGQGCDLSFKLCAEAVQAKNNANKEFEDKVVKGEELVEKDDATY